MNLDSSDFDDVSEAERLQKEVRAEAARQEADDFKWLMSDARGRRIVYRLLAQSGVFRNPFTGNDSETNFRSGMMSIGQAIWADVQEHCPEKYDIMIVEKKKHDKRIAERCRRSTE